MGQNLARNAANHGLSVGVYNRTTSKMRDFITAHGSEQLQGYATLEELVGALKTPRRVLLMVKAGEVTDLTAEAIGGVLSEGDIMIDGGNSLFRDTIRREAHHRARGVHWFGMGVSGGEEGALRGPSLMPGGEPKVWDALEPLLRVIVAKDFAGGDCVTHLGPDGAGHYVKMVHNGIEYAIMQALAEAYTVMRDGYGLEAEAQEAFFAAVDAGPMGGFLTEISRIITATKDDRGAGWLLDQVLDTAGQKGTGRWTAVEALKLGVDGTLVTAAVNARVSSSDQPGRVARAEQYARQAPDTDTLPAWADTAPTLQTALEGAMLLAYAEGFALLRAAAEAYDWPLDLAEISRIWQGGCIIRSRVLTQWQAGFAAAPQAQPLALPWVVAALRTATPALQTVTALTARAAVSTPVLTGALQRHLAHTTARSGANFLQGLRDHFGAHTYQRLDREGVFHSAWGS